MKTEIEYDMVIKRPGRIPRETALNSEYIKPKNDDDAIKEAKELVKFFNENYTDDKIRLIDVIKVETTRTSLIL